MSNRKVQAKHRAVKCDICQNWIHIKCNFVDSKTYSNIIGSPYPWFCMKCFKTIIPFSTINDDSFHLLRKGLPVKTSDGSIQELIIKLNNCSENNDDTNINGKYYNINELPYVD